MTDEKDSNNRIPVQHWPFAALFAGVAIGAIWLVIALIVATIHGMITSNNAQEFTLGDHFEEIGFDPRIEQPVQIGDTINGSAGTSRGSVRVTLGTGSGSFTSETAPASAVKLLIPLEDNKRVLVEVPSTLITYQVTTNPNATILFGFEDGSFGSANESWTYPDKADGIFDDIMFFQTRELDPVQPSVRDSDFWDFFIETPLQQWLLENSPTIQLNLTEAQLEELIGVG